jgi:5-deoxy-glucuronate isomerase
MGKLLIKPKKGRSCEVKVTPKSADWNHVGFELHRLKPGERLAGGRKNREACLVLVTGKAQIRAGGSDFGLLGKRMSPFDGLPAAVYSPGGAKWEVTAQTAVELAVCTAPDTVRNLEARVIAKENLSHETRGKGSNTRHVVNILPEGEPAQSLLVVEVVTPGGNTSSYPPHKHDVDDLPRESLLEETYYHRINPPQGFAFQRVYTDDRSLDEAMAVEDGDVVLVPRGYHPCATCHGYDLYYLNVMAGPVRTWKFHNAREHEWLLKA